MCPKGPSLDRSAISAAEARVAEERGRTAIDLQERERVRIAFDLHDGPAQTMSAALLQVRMLQDVEEGRLHGRLDELRSTLATALDEIYGLIESLGGRDSKDADLVSRVRAAVAAFTERFGIDVELNIEGECGTVSSSLQIATTPNKGSEGDKRVPITESHPSQETSRTVECGKGQAGDAAPAEAKHAAGSSSAAETIDSHPQAASPVEPPASGGSSGGSAAGTTSKEDGESKPADNVDAGTP